MRTAGVFHFAPRPRDRKRNARASPPHLHESKLFLSKFLMMNTVN